MSHSLQYTYSLFPTYFLSFLGTKFKWSPTAEPMANLNHPSPSHRPPRPPPHPPIQSVSPPALDRPIPAQLPLRVPPTSLGAGWRKWLVLVEPLTRFQSEWPWVKVFLSQQYGADCLELAGTLGELNLQGTGGTQNYSWSTNTHMYCWDSSFSD